ncbi:putative F-box domain, FBD domain, leucine-rich repeat domain, L domain-containing protein [Medicago truncatula]|uniref:Putative F-box domain, FBD domain, leucine-rich repeat domain, L domain-containing protein n=1 Tax=Medicago truncatula TaxID=3880 RepID=A0A396HD77_MEDTR|nr:putative F-box domain, FBD domain, leucine-rich repeat domain, L domain-containing protein [Medicago truncatula]
MEDSKKMDRISNLPDELLCHILSFLPTKIAFTTTVLSKRWTPLFHSLTILRFDDETVHNYAAFNSVCGFIDTFMLPPRLPNQFIKTFSLKCRFVFSDSNCHILDAWVEAAKQRCIEEFHLSMIARISNDTIFTCQTLVVLKLEWLQVEVENLCRDLPSLKTLQLRFVRFKNKNVLQQLLNASPNLEDLNAYGTSKHDKNSAPVGVKSLSLAKLVRAEMRAIDVPYNVVNNVEFLCVYQAEDIIFKSFPVFRNLIHIKLQFYCFFHGWDGIVQLLQQCPKLQIVFIRKWRSSSSKEWKWPNSVLECVSSHLRSCTILNFEGSANNLQFATYILQNARFLQDMTIDVTTRSSNEMLLERSEIIEELSSCPRISPACKLTFEYK